MIGLFCLNFAIYFFITWFPSYLLQAQASGAKVIVLANSGSDLANALKQAKEFGIPIVSPLTTQNKILFNNQFIFNHVQHFDDPVAADHPFAHTCKKTVASQIIQSIHV